MIELYTSPGTAGSIVHCALEQAGVPHRQVLVSVAEDGTTTPPGYRDLNPNATVPTLVDGDLVLYETIAILEHLVETAGGLGPRVGEPGRERLHFWLGWLTNNLMAAFYRWFKPGEMIAAEHVEALQAGAVANLSALGDVLEAQLAGRDWLLVEGPSAADIFLQQLVGWGAEIDGLVLGGPALAAHSARVAALPGVARALAQEADGSPG